MQKTIKKLPKSEISIEVSIPADIFESYRTAIISELGQHVEVSGFRKGKAPAELVEKELNPMAVLEEMAGAAINEHLAKILLEEKIDAIGRPRISITKIAAGNPLEFTAIVAVLPETRLPDYKSIAKKILSEKSEDAVTDEELDTAIIELKKAREHQKLEESGEPHDHEAFEKEERDATLTDEYVKELGPFENVEAFREKFRENIKFEKNARAQQARRVKMLEEIAANTEADIPDVLVESELEQLIARLKADIANAGISFEEYLKHIQKTEEEIRADMLPDAQKKAKSELVLHAIATAEKIEPKQEEIETETKRLMDTYKDADETRARMYVTHLLSNEEIFRFLERQ